MLQINEERDRNAFTNHEHDGIMTPRTRKFNEDIKRKLNKINRSQAVFLSKARKLDELTGESFSATIEKSFKKN